MPLTLPVLSAVVALCLLLAAPGGFTQEPAAPQPEPLQPDWWSYFESAHDADGALLNARIEAARRGIQATFEQLPEERRRQFETLSARLDRSLARLSELSESPPAMARPLRPIPAEHGLEEALELFNELRRLSRQVRLEVEELDWQEAELAAERCQQSRRRGEYLRLEKTAPGRLGRGLVIWLTPEAVKRPGAISASYLWELETSLTKHGIEIPFPLRDLHLRSGFHALHRPLPMEAGHAVEG
jgi:small-conductance mechanosensitive channel